MTTLTALADRCQVQLNDASAVTWKQDTIEAWCLEAIRDYSAYFRRHVQTTLEVTVAGQQQFSLPADFRDVLLLEFPDGEDPPRYLERRSRAHPDFWQEPGYYDYHRQPDARAPDPANLLFISDDDATTDDDAVLIYSAAHDDTLDPADAISVPAEHEHLLVLFVVWKAYAERLSTEMQGPDTTIRMIEQMKNAASTAEQSYRSAIALASNRSGASGFTGPWTIDRHDRIY